MYRKPCHHPEVDQAVLSPLGQGKRRQDGKGQDVKTLHHYNEMKNCQCQDEYHELMTVNVNYAAKQGLWVLKHVAQVRDSTGQGIAIHLRHHIRKPIIPYNYKSKERTSRLLCKIS